VISSPPAMLHPANRRHSRVTSITIAVAAAVSLTVGSVASAADHTPPASRLHSARLAGAANAIEGVPSASNVFVIVGENTSLSDLTTKNAPYIAGVLKAKSAWLNGLRAVKGSSSTGDYIEMTSGQSIKCERNDDNPVNPNTDKSICHQKLNNVFNQLQTKHISWTDWQESMPHPCAFYDDGTDWVGDVYGVHHNPAIYYDDIEGNRYVEDYNKAPKATCRQHDLPMGTTAKDDTRYFDRALAEGKVSRFNYIVPNDCQNGHDPCGTNNPVGQFDAFVKREIAMITASPAWNSHSVINVTWDEQGDSSPHDLRVGSIWFGHHVKPGTYKGHWTHASLLRTVEDAFALNHLHDAKHESVIGTIWK
jgi:phosphatidylinositol-3-phosphatase